MKSRNLILLENNEITFGEYLEAHPDLYDGIDLTPEEIETINKHFWEYTLYEDTFSHHYLEKLNFYLKQYHMMKAQEFVDKIGDITTNREILKIAGHVASNGSSTSNANSTTTNNQGARESNNKDASRNLPMKTTGADDIEDIVDWSDGGSAIGESLSKTKAVTDTIQTGDIRSLTNLSTQWNTNDSEREVIGQQAVKLIENIWNYLSKPKSMEWLCEKLTSSFILVF